MEARASDRSPLLTKPALREIYKGIKYLNEEIEDLITDDDELEEDMCQAYDFNMRIKMHQERLKSFFRSTTRRDVIDYFYLPHESGG